MENLFPSDFFDLSNFGHKDVFLTDKPVWESVKNIEPYIKKYFKTNPVHNLGGRFPRAYLEGKRIIVGTGTKIYPSAYVGENVIIGKDCEIRPGAFIRENVILGDNCIIGNSCEVKNSIMLNHAWTSHFNYIGDSIVGNNTNLAASTIFANIRYDFFDDDPKTIGVKLNDKYCDTGLLKFGAVFGDGSQTGCKCLLNPGTFVGKKSILGGFQCHKGYFPAGSKIY